MPTTNGYAGSSPGRTQLDAALGEARLLCLFKCGSEGKAGIFRLLLMRPADETRVVRPTRSPSQTAQPADGYRAPGPPAGARPAPWCSARKGGFGRCTRCGSSVTGDVSPRGGYSAAVCTAGFPAQTLAAGMATIDMRRRGAGTGCARKSQSGRALPDLSIKMLRDPSAAFAESNVSHRGPEQLIGH